MAGDPFIIRERTPSEGIDLGLVFLRSFSRQIYLFWLPPLLLTAGLLAWLLPPDLYWVSPLVLWWLKPLWDRLILAPVSHLAFHPQARVGEVWHKVRPLLLRHLAGELTVFRFSPRRSFHLPVKLLEDLKGAKLTDRQNLLAAGPAGPTAALTFLLFLLELVTAAGLTLTLAGHVFERLPATFIEGLLPQLVYVLVLALLEPAYAQGGFGLYLTRRTALEGWDLDRQFARIQPPRRAGLGPLLLWAVLALGIPQPAPAETWQESRQSVLADPDFGQTVTRQVWEAKPNQFTLPDVPRGPEFQVPSQVLMVLVVVFVAVLAGFLLWGLWARGRLAVSAQPPQPDQPLPQSRPLEPAQPTDLTAWADRARHDWQEGRSDHALALLYLVLLSELTRRGLPPSPATIEPQAREWCRGDPRLTAVLDTRIAAAYARRPLTGEQFFLLVDNLAQALGEGTAMP